MANIKRTKGSTLILRSVLKGCGVTISLYNSPSEKKYTVCWSIYQETDRVDVNSVEFSYKDGIQQQALDSALAMYNLEMMKQSIEPVKPMLEISKRLCTTDEDRSNHYKSVNKYYSGVVEDLFDHSIDPEGGK